ncbi:hypothetical protein [Bacillus suaedaesalsae]|nr:hypothetical protein [Bacillus suaedaesalsae]
MKKTYSITAMLFVILTILSGCGDKYKYEEEIVLVDQPKEEYKN